MKEPSVPQPPPIPEERTTALIDANVLFPALLRDTLLRAAEAGLYMPRWTTTILDEVSRNLVASGRITRQSLTRLLEAMERSFPDALVTGYEHLMEEMPNDQKDRHVLAAAVACEANVLLTHNLRHFPATLLRNTFGITPERPDGFLQDSLVAYPDELIQVIATQAVDYVDPPWTFKELLDRLERQVPGFVLALRQRLSDEHEEGSNS